MRGLPSLKALARYRRSPEPSRPPLRISRWAVVFLLAGAPLVTRGQTPPDAFQRLPAGPGEVRFEFVGELGSAGRSEDGIFRVLDRGHPDAPRGSEASLPVAATWIALPPGAGGGLQVSLVETEPLPWPAGLDRETRERILALLPDEGWTLGPPTRVRNLMGQQVRFCPVIPDGAGGLLYVRRALFTHRRRSSPEAAPAGRLASGQDPFESLYRGLFLNYEQARAWRTGPDAPALRKGARRGAAGIQDGPYFSSSERWVRLSVVRRDLYEVRGQDLIELGIPLSEIDPATLRLFSPRQLPLPETKRFDQVPSWMGELPIEVEDGDDGSFDAGDRILFLGDGPDGWYESLGVDSLPGLERYKRDTYNSENTYWLTWNGSFPGAVPRRLPTRDLGATSEPYVPMALDRRHLEEDLYWEPRLREFADANPGASLPAWERFWWLHLSDNESGTPRLLSVRVPDGVPGKPVRVLLRVWGDARYSRPGIPDHDLLVRINGDTLSHTTWNGFERRDIDVTRVLPMNPEAQQFEFLPRFVSRDQKDFVELAWIEFDYWRQLTARDDTLSFFAGGLSGVQSFEAAGFKRSDLLVLDGTRPDSAHWVGAEVVPVPPGGSSDFRVRFKADLGGGSLDHQFLIRPSGRLARPRLSLDPKPADGYLRERQDDVRMIIFAYRDFLSQAERLAAFRRQHFPRAHAPGDTTASVAVVDIQDVFDEFSFGRQDPTALRNFLQFAREAWNGGNPELGPAYVLLLGDAAYDWRNALGQGARSYVPSYTAYFERAWANAIYSPQFSSDDFFGFLDGPEDIGLDLFIGRLPAQTSIQAGTMVDKVISYHGQPELGPWKSRVTLVADDRCQGLREDLLKYVHTQQTESLLRFMPPSLRKEKVYLLDFGGPACQYSVKPAAAQALKNQMEEGTLIVDYTGHGSEVQLADERVFEDSGVAGLTNGRRLFLFITASCSVGKFDFLGQSLGEDLVLHPGGGAIAIFSATAVSFSGANSEMNQRFLTGLFPDGTTGGARPMGEAATAAKNSYAQPGRLDTQRFVFLGDPATPLDAASLRVPMELHAVQGGAALGDTLKRGLLTELTGLVLGPDSTLAVDFNGTASIRVQDSRVRPDPGPEYPGYPYYTLNGATIYRGDVRVEDGRFRLRFQVPAVLWRGPRGKAQISAYVENAATDGCGALDSLVVPTGAAPSADRAGPAIQLHLDGDPQSVPPGASFTATLIDSSGIDITSLVPARTLLLTVEENGIVANGNGEDVSSLVSFGEGINGFRTATLSSALPGNLPGGRRYELVLRAFDNVGNGSVARVPFFLAATGSERFSLAQVFNFPNPTEGGTRFFGTISQEAEISLRLFTLTGRRILEIPPRRITPGEFGQVGILWEGRDADGDNLANGVYLYKISARPVGGGGTETALGRLVVSR